MGVIPVAMNNWLLHSNIESFLPAFLQLKSGNAVAPPLKASRVKKFIYSLCILNIFDY